MKTGVIVYGQHASSVKEKELAEKCAEHLRSKGRKNVRIGFYHGDPAVDAVLYDMFKEGIDTFVFLPLAIAEGRSTIWLMPAKVHLPDNCGSWAIIDDKDIATRFATALGRDPRMAETLCGKMGIPDDKTGILMLSYGSELSQSSKTAEYYAEKLRGAGWKVECGYSRYGTPVEEAIGRLVDSGVSGIRAIPLFISFDGVSVEPVRKKLEDAPVEVTLEPPVSEMDVFLDILDSKVPEDW